MVLADIAARGAVGQGDPEAHAARDDGDFAGRDGEAAEFGVQRQPAQLRNDQQLAVGVPEDALHAAVGAIDMDCNTVAGGGVAVRQQRYQSGDEIGWRVGDRQWVPAQPVRGRIGVCAGRCAAQRSAVDPSVGGVIGRRANAVEPASPCLMAWDGEWCAGQLLGVEAKRRPLRRILPDRQGAWDGFGGMFAGEAGEVGQIVHGLPHFFPAGRFLAGQFLVWQFLVLPGDEPRDLGGLIGYQDGNIFVPRGVIAVDRPFPRRNIRAIQVACDGR